MSKPTYLVRFPDGQYNLCDSLCEALDRRKGEGTVYERLGHSTGRKIDVDDALLEACRECLAVVDEAYEATGYVKVAATSEQRLKIESAIAAADKFRAEMAKAGEGNES